MILASIVCERPLCRRASRKLSPSLRAGGSSWSSVEFESRSGHWNEGAEGRQPASEVAKAFTELGLAGFGMRNLGVDETGRVVGNGRRERDW